MCLVELIFELLSVCLVAVLLVLVSSLLLVAWHETCWRLEHILDISTMTKWFYSTRLETRNKECNICESSRVLNMLEK